jgi:energy-coupling factor transport system ATP-binding protein
MHEASELLLSDVGYCYDRGLPTEKAVLRSVSLSVRSGRFLSIAGRTGSGKTTLGLIMAGLLKPQSGRVSLLPSPGGPDRPGRSDPGRLDVVMVFQVPESQFFEEDVFSEVAFGPSRLGLRGKELEARVSSSLERLGLDPGRVSRRSPIRLSEGEKRNVAVASALACRPRFLILDEPTISLDWRASGRLYSLLRGLADSGVSVIVLTHGVEAAVRHSDVVAVLSGGELSAPGRLTVREVYESWYEGGLAGRVGNRYTE